MHNYASIMFCVININWQLNSTDEERQTQNDWLDHSLLITFFFMHFYGLRYYNVKNWAADMVIQVWCPPRRKPFCSFLEIHVDSTFTLPLHWADILITFHAWLTQTLLLETERQQYQQQSHINQLTKSAGEVQFLLYLRQQHRGVSICADALWITSSAS